MDFTLITFIKCFLLFLPLVAPIILFLVALVIILGQWVSYIEKWKKFDGLYWSFITATTVGYGDIRPLKKLSRVLAVIIAIIGLIFCRNFTYIWLPQIPVQIICQETTRRAGNFCNGSNDG